MENLENLEKLEKLLEKENLEKSEKEKLEKEKENLVEKINTQLKESSVEKGIYYITFSKNNKTLHFNKACLENLEKHGITLDEKNTSRKYINYIQNPVNYNIVEKLFSIYKNDFQLKENLD